MSTIRYGKPRVLTPADEIELAVSLDEAKEHLRIPVEDASEDLLIDAQIRAAMEHVEKFTGQVLTPREMELPISGFPVLPELIAIPREPVTGVSAIAYTDPDGVAAELAEADWRWSESAADVVMPALQTSWPAALAERGSVRLTFDAGYEVGLAPASLIAAVKLMLGHLYANREAVVTGTIATELPLAVQALCMPYRRVLI